MTKSKYSFIFYNSMPVGITHAYLKCFTIFIDILETFKLCQQLRTDFVFCFFLLCPIRADDFLPGSFVLSHQMQPLALLTFSVWAPTSFCTFQGFRLSARSWTPPPDVCRCAAAYHVFALQHYSVNVKKRLYNMLHKYIFVYGNDL